MSLLLLNCTVLSSRTNIKMFTFEWIYLRCTSKLYGKNLEMTRVLYKWDKIGHNLIMLKLGDSFMENQFTILFLPRFVFFIIKKEEKDKSICDF